MDGAFNSGADNGGRGGPGAGRGGFRGNAENAKTRMCNRWMQGECRFGDRCNFAHGEHELRQLPPRSGDSFGRGGGRGPFMGYGGRGNGGRYGQGRGYGGYGGPGGGYGGGYGGPQGNYGGGYGGPQGGGYQGGGYGGGMQQQQQQDGYGGNGGGGGAVYPAPTEGPNGWLMYRSKDTNEPYYHNPGTGVTTWDRPPEWPM